MDDAPSKSVLNVSLTICLSILVILISLGLLFHFYFFSNKHPHKHISSIWIMATLITIIIQQASSVIIFNLSDVIVFEIIQTLLIDNIRTLCLLMRSISIYQLISCIHLYFSSNLIMNAVSNAKTKAKIIYTSRFTYSKTFIALIVSLIIVCSLCLLITNIREGIKIHLVSLLKDVSTDAQSVLITGLVVLSIVSFSLRVPYAYFAIALFKYTLRNDFFIIKLEVVGSFIITFVFDNLQDFVYYSLPAQSFVLTPFHLFLFKLFSNVCLLALFSILTVLRYRNFRIFSPNQLIGNYHSFMNTDMTFLILKDFIRRKYEEYYRFMNFWVDSKRFMLKAQKFKEKRKDLQLDTYKMFNTVEHSNEPSFVLKDQFILDGYHMQLVYLAQMIYKDYFQMNNISGDFTKSNGLTIDFPTDIYERIEEQFKKNFAEGKFDLIYLDAYEWVDKKLECLYLKLINNIDEKEKVEKVLFYVYCLL